MTLENIEYEVKRPIINSILDLDMYKLTMGQFAYHRYPNVPVKYAFKNRTSKVKLANIVDEADLRTELDHIRKLKLTDYEANYLSTLKNGDGPMFKKDYIGFLKEMDLPDYNLGKEDGNYVLEFEGDWSKAIYWETLALSTMNELYYKSLTKDMNPEDMASVYREGQRRLEAKVKILSDNPGVRFIEFGTRRRFSQEWQERVVSYLKENTPNNIIGTSNVYLAMKHGLVPKGTIAHEHDMVLSGIMHGSDDEIRASHNRALREWWDEYGPGLSIALTDTYGSNFFFKDFTPEQAKNWIGLRQDSGRPEEFARRQIDFYENLKINPKDKLFVPSDGLEINKIVDLHNEFNDKINVVAGWGTSLTNDLGFDSLSLVVKAVESNGHGTVKLSDNPAKKTGKPEDVERFVKIFGYDENEHEMQECKY